MTTLGGTSTAKVSALVADLDFAKVVELVRIAETAERYEDMCVFVSKMIEQKCSTNTELDVDERNLLSVAYKNVVGSKRASWRTLNGAFEDVDLEMLDSYKAVVENELEVICMEVIELLTKKLIASTTDADGGTENFETGVFYLKMTGDYYRYLAEFRSANEDYKNNAKDYYEKAMKLAEEHLSETHPTRLGLALNFSVCYYEILKMPEEACDLAKKSFDSAIEKLDTLNDVSYKDSTLIMQLLRDNLTLWTSAQDDPEED
jgi:hypothetical protein